MKRDLAVSQPIRQIIRARLVVQEQAPQIAVADDAVFCCPSLGLS